MFGITELIEFPGMEDPKLVRMETFERIDDAISRSNDLMDKYHEEYGEDYYERATKESQFACAGNSDVTWRLYISEITDRKGD